MDCVGLLLLAKWTRAVLAFARLYLPVSRIPDAAMSEGSWRGRRPMYEFGRTAEPEFGDEAVGQWSPEQVDRVNARFVERVERAIAAGDESPQGAAGLGSAR
jgi:hypothetical protein